MANAVFVLWQSISRTIIHTHSDTRLKMVKDMYEKTTGEKDSTKTELETSMLEKSMESINLVKEKHLV